MKLIIQIPCYNEAGQLAMTVAELPRQIPGVDIIEYLVIDDGSSDQTAEIAHGCGIHHIVKFTKHLGLARAFMAGIEKSLEQGADIIVNTDADNQYFGGDIEKLVQPILEGRADMVVGQRPIENIEHFSRTKKYLQRLGSWLVRRVSQTDIQDAPSGFRAFSRTAASQLNIFSEYSYTLESIIQAGQNGLAVISVPIRINGEIRPSRLVKSTFDYISQSVFTILRIFVAYQPLKFFVTLGGASFIIGLLIGLRFLWFYFENNGAGHVQSLILAALLLGGGFFLCIVGILADIISVNRKLLEKIDNRLKQVETKLNKENNG
ncbi:MAG: glycosyl transferase [Parcubacteria group bacterium]|nr:MAG: glycosyl transferase [Parcubacteria group bacterium]